MHDDAGGLFRRGGEIVRQLDRSGHDLGGDDAGMEDRHGNVVIAPVQRQRMGEAGQAELAGCVGWAFAARHLGADRADIDDAPAPALPEDRPGVLGTEKGTGEVGADHPVPVIERGLVDRRIFRNTGIVDEHIDRAEPRHGFGKQVLHRGFVGDVGRHGEGFAALRLDLLHQSGKAIGPARGQHHPGAAGDEFQRACLADTRAGTGDDGDAACKIAHANSPSFALVHGISRATRTAEP